MAAPENPLGLTMPTTALIDALGVDRAGELVRRIQREVGSYAENTQRALNADRRVWERWCVDNDRAPYPVKGDDVVDFIHAKSPPLVRKGSALVVDARAATPETRAPNTIARYLASLRVLHRAAGFTDDPLKELAVERAMRTIRRGRSKPQQRQALRLTHIEKACAAPTEDLYELRARAMVGVAYSAMLRRSELVGIEVGDLGRRPDGSALIELARTKTDPTGRGQTRYLAPFVMGLVDAWLARSRIKSGPLFRGLRTNGKVLTTALHPSQVPAAFRRVARAAGLKGRELERIAGHSVRIGGAHDLVAGGFDLAAIQQAGGWASPAMPAYYARDLLAEQNAMAQWLRRRDRP